MNESKNIYSKVAKITFFLCFFFTLFGTALPFRAGTRDPSKLGTSNWVNQVVFSTLFLMALFSSIPKIREIVAIIKREKFFVIFLLWCTLSIIWAEDSFVVFKRLFQLYTAVIVCLAFLVHSESIDDAFLILKIFFGVFMVVSLISLFTIPGAISQRVGGWQGLATSKNGLGEASLISILVWIYAFISDKRMRSRLFYTFMLMVSLFLLFGAQSITSISAFMFLILMWILFETDKIFKPLGIGRTISILFLVFGFLLTIFTFYFSSEILDSVFALAGKNLTLTGRTDLWSDVIFEAKKHLLIGCGYQGFWIVDSPKILELYTTYIWLPRSGHSGYIDLLNETGIIGSFLFFMIVVNYFISLLRNKEKTFWMWFIVIALIENFTETKLFHAGGLMTLIFVLVYLSLFTNILRKKQDVIEHKQNNIYQR